MAAVQNRQHSNILAITPDARPCDAQLPTATTTTSSTTTTNNEAALAQYLQYRSAPSLYPSYDRLRFVRLPSNYLPSHLLRQNQNNNNDDNDSYSSLQYWPAIIYENYAELVRDLGKAASAKTKAKFSVRHRKFGSNAVVVARLLMWDDSLVGASTSSSEGPPPAPIAVSGNSSSEGGGGGGDSSKKSSSNTCLFPEPTIHIVQLDSSLTQLESSNSSSTRLVSFYDAQFDLEECCTNLLRRYSPSSTTSNNNKKSGGGEEERRSVYNYALQFQKAVDMALNCLALDMGGDVLHDRVMGEEGTTTTTTPGGGVASNTATTTAADAVKNGEGAEKKKKKKQVVEKRVQNLEIAVHPTNANATTTTNAITTKPKAAGPNETMKQQQDVLSRKESTTRTESKRGGGGGGTKSKRPEASQPIPKKFQSTSKATTTTATASTSTTTKDITTTTMNQTNNHPLPPWKDVWKIMRSNGWTWKGSTGLSTGYRYIKPNCKIKNGIENIDYFNSEQDVQSFARNVYGWGIRDHTYQSLSEVIQDHAKYAGEYVPPLQPMTSIGPKESWRDVWDKMRLCGGWTWKTGSGLMMDYYYIKPNGTIKGGVKGQDYFETVEEVQLFAKRNYGWVGEEEEVEGEENDGGGEKHRPALMDLNENTLPEKRRRTEKVSMDNKPAVKKVKSLKSKMEEVKPINEEEEEEVMEEEGEEEEEFEEEMASSGENDDANDDDDTSRFSEARSTYSQSGFQSKKLFINECADEYVPSLEGEQIYPDDPWNVVWKTMRKTGWTWKAGSGLMMDYYYIKPGCNVKDGEEGKDYFVSEEDVQRFAERNYGWNRGVVISSDHVDSRGKGRKRSLSTSSSDGSHFSEANDDCAADEIKKTKKKKTTKKIQMSPNQEQNDHASSAPLRPDPYTWKTLWPALQKDGWKVIKAGKYNRLHDWYYVRPDCDPGDGSSELHIDYFLSEEDVCGFARQTNYFDGYEESEPVYEESAEQAQKTEQAPKRVKSSSKHPSTPEGCKTQPQDPAKPLLSSAESCSSQFSSSSNDYYDWNNLWPVLQTGGWRVIKASNPLHDWYYVRPNRDPKDPTTKLGRHYFTCPDEVIDFVKRLDEKDGKQSRKSDIGGMLKAFEEEATVYSGSQL